MFDWDKQFGNFRATLQNTTLDKDALHALIQLMDDARQADITKYAQEWSSYLLDAPFVQAQVPALQGLSALLKKWQSIHISTARDGRNKPIFTVKVDDGTHKHNLGSQKNLTNRKNVVPKEDRDTIQAFWDQLTPIITHQLAKYPTDKNELYFLDEPNQDCRGGTTHFTLALGQITDNALLSFADHDWVRETWDQSFQLDDIFTDVSMLELMILAEDPEREVYNALYYPGRYQEAFPEWEGLKTLGNMADLVKLTDVWIDGDDPEYSTISVDFQNGDGFAPNIRTSKLSKIKARIKKAGPFGIDTIDLGTALLKTHIAANH